MRIVSLNANGIRSAARKGFFDWLARQDADLVCLQEIKADIGQLDQTAYFPRGYHCYYYPAEKKGYSGVALYSRHRPDQVSYGLDWPEFDREGRWLEARFGKLSVVSLYLPSGSSGEPRQQFKFQVLGRLQTLLKKRLRRGRDDILCGDWNIAHREIDLKNWRGNQKNSGFLPEERAWLDTLYDKIGYVDAFRRLHPDARVYTWWSNRGRAWDNDVGWRLDYQVTSPRLAAAALTASVYRERRFSDHAPLIMDYGHAL